MLIIPGQHGTNFCAPGVGMSRRDLLRVSGSGILAMSLAGLLEAEAAEHGNERVAESDSGKIAESPSSSGSSVRPIMAEGYPIRPLSLRDIRTTGIIRDRIGLSLQYLRDNRKKILAYESWGADQIGRWIGAVTDLSMITQQDCSADLRAAVATLIAVQDDGGIFYGRELSSREAPANQVWFGHGRALWGLLTYYLSTGDPSVWRSLARAADGVVKDQSRLINRDSISTDIESAAGVLVVLSQLRDSQSYLQLVQHIADDIVPSQVAQPGLTKDPPRYGHHTHSYLSIAHGLVDLAIATGNVAYLKRAEDVFEQTLPSVWGNGGVPEFYGRIYEYCDETCSAVDWTYLLLKLFDATGKVRYLDAAELTILNQLLCGQDKSGCYTSERSLDRRTWFTPTNSGFLGYFCCAMHGAQALTYIAAHVFTESQGDLSVNLLFDNDADVQRDGINAKLSQRVHIASNRLVQRLTVSNRGRKFLSLKLRLPYWCAAPALKVDGKVCSPTLRDGFISITCSGNSTSEIEVELPMKLTAISARKNVFTTDAAVNVAGTANEIGLQFGPFALMFFREMYPQITDTEIRVKIYIDPRGEPIVNQQLPTDWPVSGVVPLLIKASVNGADAMLTPCANMTAKKFTVTDPYILRFADYTREAAANR